jgi:hypothetical protein
MRKFDPVKDKFDLFIIDNASNFNMAGHILNARFPRITTIHGSEPGTSLVSSDIAKLLGTKVKFAIISDWLSNVS